MPTAAIITAAGSGKRFGEYKQFKILGEVPLLFHSVKTFSHIKEIDDQSAESINSHMKDWKLRHQKVVDSGGLHIIGTERHESRRIDNHSSATN